MCPSRASTSVCYFHVWGSACHGFGWELDTTWLVIRALAALGLATEVHLLPKNAERFRIQPEAQPEPAPAAA